MVLFAKILLSECCTQLYMIEHGCMHVHGCPIVDDALMVLSCMKVVFDVL